MPIQTYEYRAGEILGDRASLVRSPDDTVSFLRLLRAALGAAYVSDSTEGFSSHLAASRFHIDRVVLQVQSTTSHLTTFVRVREIAWAIIEGAEWRARSAAPHGGR